MISRITASLGRALRPASIPTRDVVHFHLHHDGQPFVCDFNRCDSPALTLGDVESASGSPAS
jgi:hypothetical protein